MFDHEKLDVYQVSITFVAWAGMLVDSRLTRAKLGVVRHLDDAGSSIALNIAEGNGKRSRPDRAQFLDMARGSALECAACLDILVARRRLTVDDVHIGKDHLVRIVSMLTRLIDRVLAD